MENQQKKYNSILLAFCVLFSILAIYFGVKSQNLSKKLEKQSVSKTETEDHHQDKSISKIDSLLFQKDYNYAYQISKELRQTQNFQNDSTLLLRYNLVSEIVEAKKLEDTNISYQESLIANSDYSENQILQTKLDSVSRKLNSVQRSIASNNLPSVVTRTVKTSEYLTFKTSKGTDLHYIGSIDGEMANGHGVALLQTGSRYEGNWKNNKRHGYGKFFWDDGDYYEGSYVNDKRNGLGTYYWKNGEKYIGEWKDDKRNGHGEFFNKKGKLKTSGTWEDDELIEQDEKHKKHKDSLAKR